MAQMSWRPAEDMGNLELFSGPLAFGLHDGERTGRKSLVKSHRTVEPGVPLFATLSIRLVMPQIHVSKIGQY